MKQFGFNFELLLLPRLPEISNQRWMLPERKNHIDGSNANGGIDSLYISALMMKCWR